MSTSSPSYLNASVAYDAILRLLGRPVKSSLPQVTTCIFCGEDVMRIYPDPRGGAWFACRNCEFYGDSIQLFAHKACNGDVRTAITQLLGNGLISQAVVPASVIQQYVEIAAKRNEINNFWKTCRNTAKSSDPTQPGMPVLQKFNLSVDWDRAWSKGIGQFIGVGDRKALGKVVSDPSTPSAKFLVLPFQDVPGRICSLFVHSGNKCGRVTVIDDFVYNRVEDGLFMLDSTTPGLPLVFALGDPLVALYMQRKYMQDSALPAPIVVWDDSTDAAWESVKARRVVFWDAKVTPRMFLQAKRVNGHVSTFPERGAKTPYDFVRDKYGVNTLMAEMEEHSKPWVEAVRDYVLESHPLEVAELLSMLGLTSGERQGLLEACTNKQRETVSNYLNSPLMPKSIMFDGYTITEKNGTWNIRKDGSESNLSTAVLRLHRILTYKDNRQFFSGVVEMKGKIVPFMETMDTVMSRTQSWLNNLLVNAEVGSPDIKNGWVSRLVSVAKAFEEPKIIVLSDAVGLNGASFDFPLFTISNGNFISKPDAAAASEAVPAAELPVPRPLTGEEVHDLTDPEKPGRPAFWAVMSAIMANTLSPVLKSETPARRCLGVIGKNTGMACRSVTGACGLVVKSLNDKSWKKGLETKAVSDLPTVLAHSSSAWSRVSAWRAEGHNNIITGLPIPAALCMSVTDDWLFVRDNTEEFSELPLEALQKFLPLYIAHLQTRGWTLPNELNVWLALLEDMSDWIFDLYPEYGDPKDIFESAKTMIHVGNLMDEPLVCNRMLDALIAIAKIKELGVGRAGFSPDEPIVIDDEKGTVRLDMPKISMRLEEAGIRAWDWVTVIDSLKQHNALLSTDSRMGSPVALIIPKGLFDHKMESFNPFLVLQ